jgi:mevalonate kinase
MIITAKSKTFLIGEYSILFGGSAIVFTTLPEFKLIVTKNTSGADYGCINGIEKESPAFKFYKKVGDIFKNLSIEFIDPHSNSGGLGASSAQFVMLYKLYLKLLNKNGSFPMHSTVGMGVFLDEYRDLAGTKDCIKPSGADCIAQFRNQHTYISEKELKTLKWNFKDANFLIFKTGFKVQTHIHLQQLKEINMAKIDILNSYVENVKNGFDNENISSVCSNIQCFFELLNELGLVTDNTYSSVGEFLRTDGVLAAKGCGALAADTIIVIYELCKKQNVIETAKKLRLSIVNYANTR